MLNSKKLFVITGATSGLGKSLALKFSKIPNSKLILIGRSKKKINNLKKNIYFNNKNISFFICDFSEHYQIVKLLKSLSKIKKIDYLINNAGGFYFKKIYNKIGVEKNFYLNYLSIFYFTLNLLKKNSVKKIINITSRSHKNFLINTSDLQAINKFSFWKSYKNAKFLLILFTYYLSTKFKKRIIFCIDPGRIRSEFGANDNIIIKFIFKLYLLVVGKSVDFVAEKLVKIILKNNKTSLYFQNFKCSKSHLETYNFNLQKKVWGLSMEYFKN